MQISVIGDEQPLVYVDGEIDDTNSSELRRVLVDIAHWADPFKVDLSRVEFIDSGGIGVLLECAAMARSRGTRFCVLYPSECVEYTIKRLGLSDKLGLPSEDSRADQSPPGEGNPAPRWLVSIFKVPCGPSSAATIRARIGQILDSLCLTDEEMADVRLAVGEAASNAVKYSHSDCSGTIAVRCSVDQSVLEIEVTDCGPGFDREAVYSPDFDDLPTGGMGIAIMRMVMDEVNFSFDSGTTVCMRKNLKK